MLSPWLGMPLNWARITGFLISHILSTVREAILYAAATNISIYIFTHGTIRFARVRSLQWINPLRNYCRRRFPLVAVSPHHHASPLVPPSDLRFQLTVPSGDQRSRIRDQRSGNDGRIAHLCRSQLLHTVVCAGEWAGDLWSQISEEWSFVLWSLIFLTNNHSTTWSPQVRNGFRIIWQEDSN